LIVLNVKVNQMNSSFIICHNKRRLVHTNYIIKGQSQHKTGRRPFKQLQRKYGLPLNITQIILKLDLPLSVKTSLFLSFK
jgi:hypothetical protein